MPNQTDDMIIQILWVIVISFFSAFAKELNDRAKDPKETFLLFISEVLLNGICGAITGVLAFHVTDNIYTISAVSAIGGLMGMNLITYITKIGIIYIAAMKNVSLDQINKIDLGEHKPVEKPASTVSVPRPEENEQTTVIDTQVSTSVTTTSVPVEVILPDNENN